MKGKWDMRIRVLLGLLWWICEIYIYRGIEIRDSDVCVF